MSLEKGVEIPELSKIIKNSRINLRDYIIKNKLALRRFNRNYLSIKGLDASQRNKSKTSYFGASIFLMGFGIANITGGGEFEEEATRIFGYALMGAGGIVGYLEYGLGR